MTQWDKIYQIFQQGGQAWAALSEDVAPQLVNLLNSHSFTKKQALDLGCGNGKYVVLLHEQGFSITAIDSSPIAIQMTQEIASPKAKLSLADMYEYKYPKETFDLIISISTLHHGPKYKIAATIHKMHLALINSGIIFITLPDLDHALNWNSFKDHSNLGNGTYSPNSGPEKGLPHSFYTKKEVQVLFYQFRKVNLELDTIGRWFITAIK